MILIGLTGRKGSGKDTAFGFIEEWASGRGASVVRRGFADKLKVSIVRSLGMIPSDQETAEQFAREEEEPVGYEALASDLPLYLALADALKNTGELNIKFEWGDKEHEITMSGRHALQLYGTEAHREVFAEDFWVDALLPMDAFLLPGIWGNGLDLPDLGVVTDVRFPNEAERIKQMGGAIWEIYRGQVGAEDSHASEKPLPADLVDKVIYNRSTLETLKAEVQSEMTIDYHMKFVQRPDPLEA